MTTTLKSAIASARDQLFLDTAEAQYLDVIGWNHAFPRPPAGMPDSTWRAVLRQVMVSPKLVLDRYERLLEILAGGQVSLEYIGDVLTHPPDLGVRVILGSPGSGTRPDPPAIGIELSGAGLLAPVLIDASGWQIGTPGTPIGADLVLDRAIGGQTTAVLSFAPVITSGVAIWVNPQTDAVPVPVALPASSYAVDADGTVTFDLLPAPLTFFAVDPMTGGLVPRPGLPAGAEVLAVYRIDTKTYAGLAAALRYVLPPSYRVAIEERDRSRTWTELASFDDRMSVELLPSTLSEAPRILRLATRLCLRSWAVYDAGVAPPPPDTLPTTPFADAATTGPRVFVDLSRRPDLSRLNVDERLASHILDDLPPPVPPPPPPSRPHPGGYPGPYLYTTDDALQVYGRETAPGDPTTWEPFAAEYGDVEVTDPTTGMIVTLSVRLDAHAVDLRGAPLATTLLPATTNSPAEILQEPQLFRAFALPRRPTLAPDRSDYPLVLASDDFWLNRLASAIDLVRAAGVFVSFETAPATPSGPPPSWFVDVCPLDPA